MLSPRTRALVSADAPQSEVEAAATANDDPWEPTCDCGTDETRPCIVLDPFAGSGTTGEVAERLGRNRILCELNQEYRPLIEDRTRQMGLGI